MNRFLCSVKRRNERFFYLAFLTILLLGLGLRFFQISKQPLWMDEAYSVWMASHPVSEIIRYTVDIDQHPPLYNILLHFWIQLGGVSELSVRSLSAVFGALTLIPIYFLGKTLSGRWVGFLAALILAFSPFHVQYAQETRAYTLLAFSACVSMWMTARLLMDQHTQTQVIGQQFKQFFSNWKNRSIVPGSEKADTDLSWLGYILFTALAIYGHNTAIFLPIAINLFVFGLIFLRRIFPAWVGQMTTPSLRNWLVAQIGVFLIWSPWLIGLYFQATGVYGNFWLQKPSLSTVLITLKSFLMAWLPDRLDWQWIIWIGFAGVMILGLIHYRRSLSRFLFLAALFLTPFLGELLVSFWQPIFYDRTLIWGTIPLYVLIAAGISQLHFRSYILTVVIILITLSLLSVHNYNTYSEKERWDLAAGYVAEKITGQDIILFNAGWSEIPFNYYFARYNHQVEEFGIPATLFERGELEPRMKETDLPRLRSMIHGQPRVWLVYAHNWWTDPDSLIPKTLEQEFHLVDSRMFNGMQVLLYSAK